MGVNLVSESGRYDKDYLRNYAVINIKDQLARIQGIGQVLIWGPVTTPCGYGWTRIRWRGRT